MFHAGHRKRIQLAHNPAARTRFSQPPTPLWCPRSWRITRPLHPPERVVTRHGQHARTTGSTRPSSLDLLVPLFFFFESRAPMSCLGHILGPQPRCTACTAVCGGAAGGRGRLPVRCPGWPDPHCPYLNASPSRFTPVTPIGLGEALGWGGGGAGCRSRAPSSPPPPPRLRVIRGRGNPNPPPPHPGLKRRAHQTGVSPRPG